MTKLDLRELGMMVAQAHDLTLETVVCADEVSENDDEFLTAITASADLKEICDESRR
jgi:uncharacterized protein YdbL (DUF1318 family)